MASATLPAHVLAIVKRELSIGASAALVSLTNERKNIALSIREMRFEDKSFADLRFTIPRNAKGPQDIPITLIYVNERTICEDICDKLREYAPPDSKEHTIAYYHALVGQKQKRFLEERLREGEVRILVCTDAVGMVSILKRETNADYSPFLIKGCDLRNIKRVVLWDLPRTFSSLVQRAGRAARDMSIFGEAITIVRKSTRKEKLTSPDVSKLQSQIDNADEGVHTIEFDDEDRMEIENVVEANDQEIRHVDEGGSRVERISEGEREEAVEGPNGPNSRKRAKSSNERLEDAYLTLYANTSSCLRKVWNKYFDNEKKGE